MATRPLEPALPLPAVLALIAVIAVAVGIALSFFELTIAGILAAVVAAAIWLRRTRANRKISMPN